MDNNSQPIGNNCFSIIELIIEWKICIGEKFLIYGELNELKIFLSAYTFIAKIWNKLDFYVYFYSY